ncbi:hypothetical protein ACIBU0_04375 [Streptomyces sp. NPDC049627]|uniref:hypothetical protein n=1 Tax=Streptomyces sp. NPDC049627 TaxID=3365595 RepID=UPI0037BC5C74
MGQPPHVPSLPVAIAMALGARSLLESERLQSHHQGRFGPAPSDSTMRRLLAELGDKTVLEIAKVQRRVRRHLWMLLHLRPASFPWLTVAGRRLAG